MSHTLGEARTAVAPVRGPRQWDLLLLGLIATLVALTFATIVSMPLHQDIAWPLHVGRQLLNGATPYVDVVDVHPPLIVVFAMAAQLLSDLTGITAPAAYHTLTLILASLSLVLSWQVLAVTVADALLRRVIIVLAAVLLFPFVGYSFGQEEHLMLSLTLPYVLLLYGRLREKTVSRGLRIAIGLLAGFGFAFKPFYGLTWLVLEVYAALRLGWRRSLRIESWIVAALLAAYPLGVVIFAPAYLEAASWAKDVYFHFHPTPLDDIIFSPSMALTLAALLAHRLAGADDEAAELRRLLLIVVGTGVVIVLMQRKGWSYHWYPAIAASLLTITLALLAVVQRKAWPAPRRRAAAAAGVITLLLLGLVELRADHARYSVLDETPYYLPQMKQVLATHAPDGPIMAFTTTMQIAFPLVTHTGAVWASRFACLWLLPGLYADEKGAGAPFPYHDLRTLPPLERYLIDAVYEDLVRYRPRILVIDQFPPTGQLEGFDYIQYFRRDPRFRAIFGQFTYIGNVGRFMVFKRVT